MGVGEHSYKLQALRTRTFESELCVGGQIRTDDFPYKFYIPVFGFCVPVTCALGPGSV